MGNPFEVHVWNRKDDGSYQYKLQWSGDSFIVALFRMWKLKRSGEKCVKLEWR